MNDSIRNDLNTINQIKDINEKYKRFKKFYCKNQNLDFVSVAYALFLSTLSDETDLMKSINICDRLIKKECPFVDNAKLIKYLASKKLNPNKDIRILLKELDSIKTHNENIFRKINYEKLILFDDNNLVSRDKLKQSYKVLFDSCSPDEHLTRISIAKKLVAIYSKDREYSNILEIINYMKRNKDNFSQDLNRASFYANYKLGNIDENYIPSNYFERQILNYNEYETISHIQKHMVNDYFEYQNNSVFDENIDIQKLFYDVKTYISNVSPSDTRIAADVYYIYCDDIIGYSGNQPASMIMVITESGTKNIHSMFPAVSKEVSQIKSSFIKSKKKKI